MSSEGFDMDPGTSTEESLNNTSAGGSLEGNESLEMESSGSGGNFMAEYKILDARAVTKRADNGNIVGNIIVEGETPRGDLSIHDEMRL